MADISFETDSTSFRSARVTRNSRITQFFIDRSFGLVKTPAQAAVAQFVVAVGLLLLAGYFFSKTDEVAVPAKTSQELINATLPTGARK